MPPILDCWAVKEKPNPEAKLERQKSIAKSVKKVKIKVNESKKKLAVVKGLSMISPIHSPDDQAKKPILDEQSILKPQKIVIIDDPIKVVTKKVSKRNISKSPDPMIRNDIEIDNNGYDDVASFGDPDYKLAKRINEDNV